MSFAAGVAVGFAMGKKMFEGGGGDAGEHDPDYQEWLDLPEPNATQAVFLIQVGTGFMNCCFNTFVAGSGLNEDGFSVDWGDSSDVEIFAANVTTIAHAYATEGEYVVTFSRIKDANVGIGKFNTGSAYARIIMAKYGKEINIPYSSAGFIDCKYLRYLRLSPDVVVPSVSNGFFKSCFSLKEVEYDATITALTPGMFSACYNLNFDTLNFDISTFDIPNYCFNSCFKLKLSQLPVPTEKITSIGIQAFSQCKFTKINLPNCISIGSQGFYRNYILREINAPNCKSVGSYGLNGCMILSKAVFSEDCTFGDKCFEMCYALRPKPDGTTS